MSPDRSRLVCAREIVYSTRRIETQECDTEHFAGVQQQHPNWSAFGSQPTTTSNSMGAFGNQPTANSGFQAFGGMSAFGATSTQPAGFGGATSGSTFGASQPATSAFGAQPSTAGAFGGFGAAPQQPNYQPNFAFPVNFGETVGG